MDQPIPTIAVEPPKINWLLSLLSGIVILLVGITVGLMVGKYIYVPKPTPTPLLSPTPQAKPDPSQRDTSSWKTFITDDKKVSFKYPSGWTADQNTTSEGWGKSITTANLKNDKFHLSVSVANAFMNECMQEISKQTITLSETTFYKRYFTGVYLYSGEACSNKENLENSEIWLQPTLIDKEPYNYQYGLLFNYKNLNKSEAETLFDQILSTFKFVEATPNQPIVTNPVANSKISSPLIITGTVPAGWMFEGVFLIELVDADKKFIAQGQGKETVPGSWTSGKAIDFSATLTFTTTAKSGFIVLGNDNASGLPEKNIFFEIPVTF